MPEGRGAAGLPLVGDVIAGKYRIDSVLGEGGMGIVYDAEHVVLRQRVAIKALLPGADVSLEVIERFSFEASTVARLTSEHVVRVMDAGTLPSGSPYLVMEYLAGSNLDTLLARRGPMPEPEVADIALQALEALGHAHAAGIVHRDLKPANLFLAKLKQKSGRSIIKLLDFGISMSVGMSPDGDRILGSPLYMSPEQLERGATIDFRTDLWSLGVVMYQLVCGAPPFVANSLPELVMAIRSSDPISLHARDPRISPGFSEAVSRCMRRDPLARWASAAELAAALVPFGTGTWTSVLERIEEALAEAEAAPSIRSFESVDNALQALEKSSAADAPEPVRIPLPMAAHPAPVIAWADTLASGADDVVNAVTCLPPSAARDRAAPRGPALRIALVDDGPQSGPAYARIFSAVGFDVRLTASPAEVEKMLEEWRPHLVVMDVSPSLNGELLCRRVKARFRATLPVVLVSELVRDEELAERAHAAGADGYVAKVGDGSEVLAYVRNLLAMTHSPEDVP